MFDTKCRELAEAFLSETAPVRNDRFEENVQKLSQQIQDTIEAFLASIEDVADVE